MDLAPVRRMAIMLRKKNMKTMKKITCSESISRMTR